MRSRTADTLTIDDIGNVGWTPVTFLTPEGFRYYLPAFVRLSLAPAEDSYLQDLLGYIKTPHSRYLSRVSIEERAAIVEFMKYVLNWRPDLYGEYGTRGEILEALGHWEPTDQDDAVRPYPPYLA